MNNRLCPICGSENVDAEFVDVGVGEVQCGPYGCYDCGSSEVGPYDTPQDVYEVRHGWYVHGERLEN